MTKKAKCNMTEAGKMCEMHGMEACPKEEKTAADEQPMYNGKDKTGKRQLILDKNKLEERHMNAADRAREEILKRKYDESEMKSEMIKQYGPKEGQKIYFAYIRKHAMKKGNVQKEESAPGETPIKLPSGRVGDNAAETDTGKV